MNVRAWVFAIVLLGMASAQQDSSVDAAFDRLAHVDRFALGGIDFAGITSQGEKEARIAVSFTSLTLFPSAAKLILFP
jgi:hypothetical protein